MSPFIIGIGVSVLAVNVIVSLRVLLSSSYLGSQKLLQLLLIWLIPIAGVLVTFGIMRDDERKATRLEGQSFDPPANPPGIGISNP